MRLCKTRRGTKLEMNMTPMIDVTFLLLIFFMTVNQVSKASSERVQPPRQAGSRDESDTKLIIEIDPAGRINFAGQTVTAAGLVQPLKAKIAEEGNDPSRLRVVVRADHRGDCRTVNEVVNLLILLDIHAIGIKTQTSDR